MYSILPPIKYGTTPNVLLLGNGINRCMENYGISWSKLLESISLKKFKNRFDEFSDIPFPLKTVIFTGDHVDRSIDKFAMEFMPGPISQEHVDLLKGFVDLPFDAILTTNYSYEIEQAILPEFSCAYKTNCKYRITNKKGNNLEDRFGIFKYYSIGNADNIKNIWHIHGDAAHPNGIVLGHYYYGELLSIIQQQIHNIKRIHSVCQKNKIDYKPNSWIEYFLLGNIYIVGLGMDLSEMDIWWLLNCKSRNFNDCGKVIYYEPEWEKESKKANIELAKAYNIVIDKESVSGNEYSQYYKKISKKIAKTVI